MSAPWEVAVTLTVDQARTVLDLLMDEMGRLHGSRYAEVRAVADTALAPIFAAVNGALAEVEAVR